ncbi:hypothetical protein KSF78_0009737 [Schistosoma japonicum]|nr:hypothetical protein KSF78_0009737 [Schistosoma japonicum]
MYLKIIQSIQLLIQLTLRLMKNDTGVQTMMIYLTMNVVPGDPNMNVCVLHSLTNWLSNMNNCNNQWLFCVQHVSSCMMKKMFRECRDNVEL